MISLFALYLITADNIIEIASYKDPVVCSRASAALQDAGVRTFCKTTTASEDPQ